MAISDSFKNFPDKRCYGIATIKSTYIPGDERSRTAPGHGYPAHYEYSTELQVFTEVEEWQKKVAELEMPKFGIKKDYRAFVIEPATVTVEFTVGVKKNE